MRWVKTSFHATNMVNMPAFGYWPNPQFISGPMGMCSPKVPSVTLRVRRTVPPPTLIGRQPCGKVFKAPLKANQFLFSGALSISLINPNSFFNFYLMRQVIILVALLLAFGVCFDISQISYANAKLASVVLLAALFVPVFFPRIIRRFWVSTTKGLHVFSIPETMRS